jgi:hypothetical protein
LEGIKARVTAKLGPLPVWAWALLAVLAIVAWMYFTKSGFFAPASPADQSSQGSSAGPSPDANFPLDLGGLSGGGNPASPMAQTQVVPSVFDPGSGSYTATDGGYLQSSGLTASSGYSALSEAPVNTTSATIIAGGSGGGPSSGLASVAPAIVAGASRAGGYLGGSPTSASGSGSK